MIVDTGEKNNPKQQQKQTKTTPPQTATKNKQKQLQAVLSSCCNEREKLKIK